MSLFRYFLAGFLGAVLIGGFGSARAEQGVVIEIYVSPDGSAEITCPTSACQAICRDVEGQSLLVQGAFYRIGSNCTIELSDGAALQDAVEELLALLGGPIPGIRVTGGTGEFDPFVFDSQAADPAQNTEQSSDLSPSTPLAQ